MKRVWRAAAALASALLLATAVVGATATGAHRAQSGQFPIGAFTTVLTADDFSSHIPTAARDFLVGQWTITLADTGDYGLMLGNQAILQGQWAVSDNLVTFTDTGGIVYCMGDQAAGTYQWDFDGQTLTLTPVDETCESRRTLLSSHPLSAQ